MTDYDKEADRLSDELDAWLKAHPSEKVTGSDARFFGAMVRNFSQADANAVNELRRANQHYQQLADRVRQAALHNEELRRGRPLSFVERHFQRPAGAAYETKEKPKGTHGFTKEQEDTVKTIFFRTLNTGASERQALRDIRQDIVPVAQEFHTTPAVIDRVLTRTFGPNWGKR